MVTQRFVLFEHTFHLLFANSSQTLFNNVGPTVRDCWFFKKVECRLLLGRKCARALVLHAPKVVNGNYSFTVKLYVGTKIIRAASKPRLIHSCVDHTEKVFFTLTSQMFVRKTLVRDGSFQY